MPDTDNGCREEEMEKEEDGARLKGEDIICWTMKEIATSGVLWVEHFGPGLHFDKNKQKKISMLKCMRT